MAVAIMGGIEALGYDTSNALSHRGGGWSIFISFVCLCSYTLRERSMAAMISVGHICKFEESPSRNHVVGLPKYLAVIFNANEGDNPFAEFLSGISPGCRVEVQLSLSVVKDKV